MDLKTFFTENPVAALAFSGGTDSAYLLYTGMKYGAKIKAYYVKTPFQPQFEFDDAKRLAEELGADMTVIQKDALENPKVRANPTDRCYHCKNELFKSMRTQAAADGYKLLIDGTNASDCYDDRPGMRALKELEVRSPLRECGITKTDVRRLSKEAGLFTWNKPSYACLATRIPSGTEISHDILRRVEAAEDILFAMGFTDFRVRVFSSAARLQMPEAQLTLALEKRGEILEAFKPLFTNVLLDMNVR